MRKIILETVMISAILAAIALSGVSPALANYPGPDNSCVTDYGPGSSYAAAAVQGTYVQGGTTRYRTMEFWSQVGWNPTYVERSGFMNYQWYSWLQGHGGYIVEQGSTLDTARHLGPLSTGFMLISSSTTQSFYNYADGTTFTLSAYAMVNTW